MRTKLFLLALASCLELAIGSSSAQAQLFGGLGGRRWGVSVGTPAYYDGYYGYYRNGSYYQPGAYYSWGDPYYTYGRPWFGRSYYYPAYESAPILGTSYMMSNYAVNPTTFDGSVTVAPITGTDIVASAPGAVTTQSFYSGPPPATDNRMEFRVILPATDAKVYFDDRLVEQQGEDRHLVTPAAAPGLYHYQVRATWMDNGQEKSELHVVNLQPGQIATVKFGQPRENR